MGAPFRRRQFEFGEETLPEDPFGPPADTSSAAIAAPVSAHDTEVPGDERDRASARESERATAREQSGASATVAAGHADGAAATARTATSSSSAAGSRRGRGGFAVACSHLDVRAWAVALPVACGTVAVALVAASLGGGGPPPQPKASDPSLREILDSEDVPSAVRARTRHSDRRDSPNRLVKRRRGDANRTAAAAVEQAAATAERPRRAPALPAPAAPAPPAPVSPPAHIPSPAPVSPPAPDPRLAAAEEFGFER